ncbi:putative ribonuclease H-like domain-containing protein [Tanacetum coccineum]
MGSVEEEEEFGPVIYRRRRRALSVQPSQRPVRSWVVADDDDDVDDELINKNRSVFIKIDPPDVLDCPICLHPLFTPIFQCDNGHIACSSCCSKLKTKCPFCCTPIGINNDNRCRGLEKFIQSITRISCKYAMYGCKNTMPYCDKTSHEQTCPHATCNCPHPSCSFADSYKNLYLHFHIHSNSTTRFTCNTTFSLAVEFNQKRMFLQEQHTNVIFILNHQVKQDVGGRAFSIDYLGPPTSKSCFVYQLTVKRMKTSLSLQSEPGIYTEWSSTDTHKRNYLTIPSDFEGYSGLLSLSVCIRKCISSQFEVEAEEETTEEVFGNEDNDIANGALQVVLADPGVLDCSICHEPFVRMAIWHAACAAPRLRQSVLSAIHLVINIPVAEVWSDAPIIEEYESDSDHEYVYVQTKRLDTPSFAKKQVKTPRENVKNQSTHSQKPKDNPHRTLKNKGIIDNGCSRHMTGNKAYLADFQDFNGGHVAFGGSKGYITGKGIIKTGKLDFEDVSFVKELQHFNLFFVSQMCDKKNKVLFTDSECLVLSPDFKLPDENQILLKVPRQNNMYSFNLENIVPLGGLACLIAKATTDESNLWHRRLGHVNFKNLNRLVKGNLVRGLPTKLFQNDHTCVACQKGKQHKASCKAKLVSSISHTLQLLHMDLFGPTSVRSINHKTYCLVITDDFSRFSWTFFLRTKDETSAILKDFIRQIENQLNQKVKTIRCDNGTEFKNRDVIEFCGLKGIKREYSNARTPQQNGVAERKNRTLIEAARTMLADSFLPNTFWAEAVSTA